MSEQPLSKKERRERRRMKKEAKRQEQERIEQQGKNKFWIGLLGVITIVVGIVFWQPGSVNLEAVEAGVISSHDYVKGNPDASVLLVKYSDFQCPACQAYAPIVDELIADYGNDIAFVYRHFPLESIHPSARLAGIAAEAAGVQGKFYEMHDMLFDNQSSWSRIHNPRSTFEDYAASLGLDVDQFKSDMGSREIKAQVSTDISSARQLGLTSTPSFFINGERITNPPGEDAFKLVIENAILEYGGSLPEVEESEDANENEEASLEDENTEK